MKKLAVKSIQYNRMAYPYEDVEEHKWRESVEEDVARLGFRPLLIADPPEKEYKLHQHKTAKLLVFLGGSMLVWVDGKKYICNKGDLLYIPPMAPHRAMVGERGCEFYWSEKLVG